MAVSSSLVVSPISTGKRLREDTGRVDIVAFESVTPPFSLVLAGGDGEGVAVSDPLAVPLDVEAISGFKGLKKCQTFMSSFPVNFYLIQKFAPFATSAFSAFILEVLAQQSKASPRLCNNDPSTIYSGTYLKHLFPKSKFIFMVRDGRANVHSIITRN